MKTVNIYKEFNTENNLWYFLESTTDSENPNYFKYRYKKLAPGLIPQNLGDIFKV